MTGRRRGISPAPEPAYQCATCGALFPSYGRAEKHVDTEHGHGRISTVTPTRKVTK